MRLLDVDELGTHLDCYRQRLFRMETLPAYAVSADGDDYHRWVAGEREPTWERKQPWLDVLRADRVARKIRYRVRILSKELTDYERYACEWGYALNAEAGEDIRVLRRGEHDIPSGIIERDFWVVDDDQVVAMHYDKHGQFEGAEPLPWSYSGMYRNTRDVAWAAGEPFGPWWARHPELHRYVAA
ncbi:MAG: hypothetical protein GEU83_14375 [Pseudonocardiaceae bacterium]|nr:hypothetical protein [Pseudonocardiaceae bacterium]